MDFSFGGGPMASNSGSAAATSGALLNLSAAVGGPGSQASDSAGAAGGMSAGNGPILYTEPNRTSAFDDIRSLVIYIFIVAIFSGFFLILPGIRNEKFPTFLIITTSLIGTSIIVIALLGTNWHGGEALISSAYKAFSRDRVQGDLAVRIGLQSVNITLRARKYYILHAEHGPMIMENMLAPSPLRNSLINSNVDDNFSLQNKSQNLQEQASMTITTQSSSTLTPSGLESADSGADLDEPFEDLASSSERLRTARQARPSPRPKLKPQNTASTRKSTSTQQSRQDRPTPAIIKRVNVDINYNERFYWIGPSQMGQEFHGALERGLPYPILTVVEYLSHDEAGFSWSRQYRLAGYYSSTLLWLALSLSFVMFFLHCAAPKYGIYAMQLVGCLMLTTNFAYSNLVPSGDQKLVIPFEGQSLTFKFGWNYWLLMIGGTLIVIIDLIFPNFIFTTILDVDFDYNYKRMPPSPSPSCPGAKQRLIDEKQQRQMLQRPSRPPYLENLAIMDSPRSLRARQVNQRASSPSELSGHFNEVFQDDEELHQPSDNGSREFLDKQLKSEIIDDNLQTPKTTAASGKGQLAITGDKLHYDEKSKKKLPPTKLGVEATHHRTPAGPTNQELASSHADQQLQVERL